AGSTWPGDERMLGGIMESMPEDFCIILAPHEIGAARIRGVTGVFPDTFLLYSRREQARGDERVMVIDNIGMLSSIYRYASVAWVGGGFGSGLHNILEPAAHGKPVIFGPDHRKFPEASALIAAGGAFSVKDPAEATKCLLSLLRDPQYARLTGERSKSFVESQRGACEKIVLYCSEIIAQVARNAGAGAHRR
ncbi:MAG: hypothetical protein IH599_01390, partial [Bacteroidales bacterium]|nr:hypothetical protein [Bacteroidales bacterium]